MSNLEDNMVWRIIARINDEIIVKESSSAEKAIRAARNAVCKRLCDTVGITYELGWWKGRRHKIRREFVDNFLGQPLYLMMDEEVAIELHDVPYEFYTHQQVLMIFDKGKLMKSENIDSWGNLHFGSSDWQKFPLMGTKIPIPKSICNVNDLIEEEVLAIFDAQMCLENCPKCKEEIPFGTIILMTENYRLVPAQCCNEMIWSKEDLTETDKNWI
tara:strand:+ start:949 stop:1593 length:645 start_codon:yes stop_codon:yes gene_type:complete